MELGRTESGITKIARTGRFAIQVRSNQDRSHFLVLYLTRRTLYDLDNGIFISKYLPHRTEPIPCPHAHPRLRLGAGSTRHTSMSLPCPCGVVQGKISHQVLTMILKVDALTQKEPIYIPMINWTLPLRWCKAIANRLKKNCAVRHCRLVRLVLPAPQTCIWLEVGDTYFEVRSRPCKIGNSYNGMWYNGISYNKELDSGITFKRAIWNQV